MTIHPISGETFGISRRPSYLSPYPGDDRSTASSMLASRAEDATGSARPRDWSSYADARLDTVPLLRSTDVRSMERLRAIHAYARQGIAEIDRALGTLDLITGPALRPSRAPPPAPRPASRPGRRRR
ncbi:hypothetical protein [Nonomuraea wenchangensis]|uniref:hypothetical protein n=1 Tax=Nonomuraea wenchangensis TaxID=568860 RepID=UPI003323EFE8